MRHLLKPLMAPTQIYSTVNTKLSKPIWKHRLFRVMSKRPALQRLLNFVSGMIRTVFAPQINGQMTQAPAPTEGDRITRMLSQGGARKIAESCKFMALQHGGF